MDTRFDGTAYLNLAHSAIFTTAAVQVLHMSRDGVGTNMALTADAGAGTVRGIGWGNDLRIRYTIGGATSTFNFRIWFNGIG